MSLDPRDESNILTKFQVIPSFLPNDFYYSFLFYVWCWSFCFLFGVEDWFLAFFPASITILSLSARVLVWIELPCMCLGLLSGSAIACFTGFSCDSLPRMELLHGNNMLYSSHRKFAPKKAIDFCISAVLVLVFTVILYLIIRGNLSLRKFRTVALIWIFNLGTK